MSAREIAEVAAPPIDDLVRLLELVARRFGVSVASVLASRSRDKEARAVIDARHVAMFVARRLNLGYWSSSELARRFGRDHTTLLKACDRIESEARKRSAIGVYAAELVDRGKGRFDVKGAGE